MGVFSQLEKNRDGKRSRAGPQACQRQGRGPQVASRGAAGGRGRGQAAASGQPENGRAAQPAQDRRRARCAWPSQRQWPTLQRQVGQEHGRRACPGASGSPGSRTHSTHKISPKNRSSDYGGIWQRRPQRHGRSNLRKLSQHRFRLAATARHAAAGPPFPADLVASGRANGLNHADRAGRPQDCQALHDKWSGVTEDEYDFPPKPPRMRWATYSRLEAQYDDLENRWALGIMARFARY